MTIRDPSKPTSIMKLPKEVMSNIFLLACGVGCLAPPQESSQQLLQLSLQLVCKDWNLLVRRTPELWSNLVVMITPMKTMPKHGPRPRDFEATPLATINSWLRRANSWLKFAGHRLISLELLLFPCIPTEVAACRARIFSFLAAYRFKKLRIFSCNPRLLDLDESLDGSMSSVETLSLNLVPWLRSSQILSRDLPLSSLKNLTLGLDGIYLSKNLSTAFPWYQLERLVLSRILRPDLAADILRQCISLINCMLFFDKNAGNFVPLADIFLPKLEYLIASSDAVDSFTHMDAFLHGMVTPNLKSLYISGSRGMSPEAEFIIPRSGSQDVLGRSASVVDPSLESPCGVERSPAVVDLRAPFRLVLKLGSIEAQLKNVHIELRGSDPAALLDMVDSADFVGASTMPSSNIVFSFPRSRAQEVHTTHAEQVARLRDKYRSRFVLWGFDDGKTGVEKTNYKCHGSTEGGRNGPERNFISVDNGMQDQVGLDQTRGILNPAYVDNRARGRVGLEPTIGFPNLVPVDNEVQDQMDLDTANTFADVAYVDNEAQRQVGLGPTMEFLNPAFADNGVRDWADSGPTADFLNSGSVNNGVWYWTGLDSTINLVSAGNGVQGQAGLDPSSNFAYPDNAPQYNMGFGPAMGQAYPPDENAYHGAASAADVYTADFSSRVHPQMPHSMHTGPPTLTYGGGAEVPPVSTFDHTDNLAASWFASNNGFAPVVA
ncbi:hypothetical protein AX15_007390 [Amanita polypyramis BW_CC]|nr:hypothetical protein AX15_007390 [Amanita polypyramis BW_CC]